MNSTKPYAVLVCLLVGIGGGCGPADDTRDGTRATDDDIPWKVVDAPTDLPPQACMRESAADLPLLALEAAQLAETFVSPDVSADALGIDYDVVPPTSVDRVEVRFDFDHRLGLQDLVYEERCLESLPLADLRDVTENDVVTAVVSAVDDSGREARRGRVTLPVGSARMNLVTVDLGAEEAAVGEWYFVFEPAAGEARIMLTPANVSRTTFEQQGLPDIPGAVALVRTDEVLWDAATRVAYARPGFTAHWRARALEWHGLLRARGDAADVPRRLRALRPAGATLTTRPLRGDIEHDFDAVSHLLLEVVGDLEATLRVRCEQLPLHFEVAGLAELTVGDTAILPGGGATPNVVCSDDEDGELMEVTIATVLFIPRPQHVVVTRSEDN